MTSSRSLDVLWAKHEALESLTEERRESDQRALDLQGAINSVKFDVITTSVARIEKLLYVGMGILLAAQFAAVLLKR